MNAEFFPFQKVEAKWQKRWDEKQIFKVQEDTDKPKFYLLEMFPYPSGRIHMGHVRNYSIGDVMARYQTMRGYNVLHPMGWDAFGLPAENAAIQNNRHPVDWTVSNVSTMQQQLRRMGFSYDWDREVTTCTPEYYHWCQWMFLRFYEKGLAYRKESLANWCEPCQTVLANEQVEGGDCWRCGNPVVQKSLEQWFFRITDYADELLDDLDKLTGWPERVVTMQRNWIGKSRGAEIDFPLADGGDPIRVFTTRPDTVYGATYMVLAPEHPLVQELSAGTPQEKSVTDFVEQVSRMEKEVRTAEDVEKNGVFVGAYCINPMTEEHIPIWTADYVLLEYGTGAVMAVPTHDQRDFEFARKYGLKLRVVIQPPGESLEADTMIEAYIEPGTMANSGSFDGTDSIEGIQKITDHMADRGVGQHAINYRLRDWCISRQRYWGAPIPMIYCDDCGVVPVPDEDLPVRLPENADFSKGSMAVLRSDTDFLKVNCPKCGGEARRETDTMDTFVDSSWYFARYVDPRNTELPFSRDASRYWLPVDHYVGGVEHAVMHLLYARFFTKVMRDLGLSEMDEPFTRLLTQGMVCMETYSCPDHGYIYPAEVRKGNLCPKCDNELAIGRVEKMSKSKNNVVDPNDILDKFGADTMRVFSLFAAPPERDLEWNDQAVEGAYRFLNRVWRIVHELMPLIQQETSEADGKGPARKLRRMTHETIRRVTVDIDERLHFNTAISAIMELVNHIYQIKETDRVKCKAALREAIEAMVQLLSPFAPHIAEEIWEKLGHTSNVTQQPWPVWDEKLLVLDEVQIVVQVNGKLRSKINVPADADEETVRTAALGDEKIQRNIEGKQVVKVVVIPNRLVNVVVR